MTPVSIANDTRDHAQAEGIQVFYENWSIDDVLLFWTLDEESKELCKIVTPYGKFQYARLPMGVQILPDVAQSFIKKILTDLDIEVYIDNIGIWPKAPFKNI